ncbi:ABC transporter ATP-binding protein [Ketogulonicigenium vulgare]|uniref:ABC transporter nucleotide binding/ATPase protein n=1 Tax=Ketogulonicigenium vulgare (strain WSH-001) TaxID=759362 RepID=F9Y8Q9_KETVW|nr:ABC transporter ATP-binding protein [Ketogulonicigenium vulgare]ADO43050.1 sugar ABC transporter [Ketogulonicigenium vulgare Y25]AEM41228.1 ABC transporter nucleotide binding/ATPase protein [Ketogulonicigenium vulgare WSH-001]ALJ81370.1 ABC transporter ATP-binding protein [Ketogulonicigenium vulgare]ANW34101.1 ABC transporter ATP-binding protein [Ketogulonicigenium vulgare]AOZ54961.1 sugar ABC transporter [Ketogulonicigenium vulgare]
MKAPVRISNLCIDYANLRVLSNLNLDIAGGEFVVLLGPSGCGKSTLLNAIAGFNDVAEGSIEIGGQNVTWAEPKDRGIGMVFQSYALYPKMTVRQNLAFALETARVSKSEIEARIARTAKVLQLDHLLARRPAQLSGGQRQRVAIGRALVRDVGVFLFDEPLSNLDAQLRNDLRIEIKRLHKQLNATIVYVTHDQVEAMTLADRIAVMNGGVIQQLGTPAEVYHTPANKFVASFLGSPRMNFIEGTLEGATFRAATGELLDVSAYPFAAAAKSGPVTLGVRPEKVNLAATGTAGKISVVEPMGADTVIWVPFMGTDLTVRLDGEARVAEGDTVYPAFAIADISLFDGETGARL